MILLGGPCVERLDAVEPVCVQQRVLLSETCPPPVRVCGYRDAAGLMDEVDGLRDGEMLGYLPVDSQGDDVSVSGTHFLAGNEDDVPSLSLATSSGLLPWVWFQYIEPGTIMLFIR